MVTALKWTRQRSRRMKHTYTNSKQNFMGRTDFLNLSVFRLNYESMNFSSTNHTHTHTITFVQSTFQMSLWFTVFSILFSLAYNFLIGKCLLKIQNCHVCLDMNHDGRKKKTINEIIINCVFISNIQVKSFPMNKQRLFNAEEYVR